MKNKINEIMNTLDHTENIEIFINTCIGKEQEKNKTINKIFV